MVYEHTKSHCNKQKKKCRHTKHNDKQLFVNLHIFDLSLTGRNPIRISTNVLTQICCFVIKNKSDKLSLIRFTMFLHYALNTNNILTIEDIAQFLILYILNAMLTVILCTRMWSISKQLTLACLTWLLWSRVCGNCWKV